MRTRASLAEADAALTPVTERRIAVAADLWCANFVQRFDLVLVAPWRRLRYVPDAFRVSQ